MWDPAPAIWIEAWFVSGRTMKSLCLSSGFAWALPKQTGNAKWSPTPTRAVGRLWKKVLSQDSCSGSASAGDRAQEAA